MFSTNHLSEDVPPWSQILLENIVKSRMLSNHHALPFLCGKLSYGIMKWLLLKSNLQEVLHFSFLE